MPELNLDLKRYYKQIYHRKLKQKIKTGKSLNVFFTFILSAERSDGLFDDFSRSFAVPTLFMPEQIIAFPPHDLSFGYPQLMG